MTSLLTSRRLALVAAVLVVLYVTPLVGAVLPAQPLDPAWQLRLGGSLVTMAPFPLLGLALLHQAADLAPQDHRLERRRQTAARLAVAAALGFLLLIPLLSSATLRLQRNATSFQGSQISTAERKLAALRAAVVHAASGEQLNAELQKLEGPVLGPADLAQPLPLLKAQVGSVLDQAALQIRRQKEITPAPRFWDVLPALLPNILVCLALAIGFAGLAPGRIPEHSLLQEWQRSWRRSTAFLTLPGRDQSLDRYR